MLSLLLAAGEDSVVSQLKRRFNALLALVVSAIALVWILGKTPPDLNPFQGHLRWQSTPAAVVSEGLRLLGLRTYGDVVDRVAARAPHPAPTITALAVAALVAAALCLTNQSKQRFVVPAWTVALVGVQLSGTAIVVKGALLGAGIVLVLSVVVNRRELNIGGLTEAALLLFLVPLLVPLIAGSYLLTIPEHTRFQKVYNVHEKDLTRTQAVWELTVGNVNRLPAEMLVSVASNIGLAAAESADGRARYVVRRFEDDVDHQFSVEVTDTRLNRPTRPRGLPPRMRLRNAWSIWREGAARSRPIDPSHGAQRRAKIRDEILSNRRPRAMARRGSR